MAKKQPATTPQRKPKGFGNFKDLMQKLAKVPKAEIDRMEAERKAADSKKK